MPAKPKKTTDDSLQTTAKQKKTVVRRPNGRASPLAGSPKTVDKQVTTKPGSLSVPVLSLAGVWAGSLNLPKSIFGAEVNKALLAQALRVYNTNLSSHWANTKTRGEVAGSTRKMYRQKGTGNARRGSRRSPVAVHGGIALGPRTRKVYLELPKKMRRAALVSALSQKIQDGDILALDSLDKATGKTKQIFKLFKGLEKKSALIINDKQAETTARAVRNIKGVNFLTVDQLNAYEVIKYQSLLITKAAVERLEKGPHKPEVQMEAEKVEKVVRPKTKKEVKK